MTDDNNNNYLDYVNTNPPLVLDLKLLEDFMGGLETSDIFLYQFKQKCFTRCLTDFNSAFQNQDMKKFFLSASNLRDVTWQLGALPSPVKNYTSISTLST